jgi:hypothetical protein
MTVTAALVRARIPLGQRADWAIAREETREHLGTEVPVHNIRGTRSGPFRVVIRDRDGLVVPESAHEGLEAPVDRQPRVLSARFPVIRLEPGMEFTGRLQAAGDFRGE